MSIILWFIVIYLLFRFIFRFVIPLISAARTVRSKVNEARQNMQGYQGVTTNPTTSSSSNGSFNKSETKPTAAKGDYIDFEEIK